LQQLAVVAIDALRRGFAPQVTTGTRAIHGQVVAGWVAHIQI
jgi:hypothetical protein